MFEFLLDLLQLVGVDFIEFDSDGVNEHLSIFQSIEHGVVAVVGELVHQNLIAVLLKTINPAYDAFVVGLDDIETVLGCPHYAFICHVVLMKIQVGNCQVVV